MQQVTEGCLWQFSKEIQNVGPRTIAAGVEAYLLLVPVISPVLVTNASYADPVIRTVSTRGIDAGDCIRDPCRTIQFAIDTAADGDTIRVRQGVYEEALEIHEKNSLLIEGIDANKTIILGQRVTSQIRNI